MTMARYPVRLTGNTTSFLYRDCYELPPLPRSEDQDNAVAMANSDPLAAKKCLRLFALRIRHQMTIGDRLAEHVASALEAAADEPASKSAKALTDALGITAPRRRRAGDTVTVGQYIEDKIRIGQSKTAAIGAASKHFAIDRRTAGRYLVEYQSALEESQRE